MKACGIVAEYNPFHNGHAYQVEQVRKEVGADVVIAVMSGNFLQRGEPAIVDKWTRTKMALGGGVDLLVELPVVFSTQPADFFAKGAIQILSALQIDTLSFGVESGSASDFFNSAQWLFENEERIAEEIKKGEKSKEPYAKQMELIIESLAPDFPLHLQTPNNQLGFAYAKEIIRLGLRDEIELFPLERAEAGYADTELTVDSPIASATAIRQAVLNGKEVSTYIPKQSYSYFKEAAPQMVHWENYFSLLKYQLTVQSKDSLREIYQMTEGLENRLKDFIREAESFEGFMRKIKTKRYTQTRLQRLLTYTLLQWEKNEIIGQLEEEPAIRVLGFNQTGQEYLGHVKHSIGRRLVSNVGQKQSKKLRLDIQAGAIYQLGARPSILEQDFKRKPIKFD
ncbi:MAG TPA: nucleotidyltransferase [Atopostipes sp.]|nr:nucleotidyltransferase [Atopostipes sp.]